MSDLDKLHHELKLLEDQESVLIIQQKVAAAKSRVQGLQSGRVPGNIPAKSGNLNLLLPSAVPTLRHCEAMWRKPRMWMLKWHKHWSVYGKMMLNHSTCMGIVTKV